MIRRLQLNPLRAGLLLGLLAACQAEETQGPPADGTGPLLAPITGYSLTDISPPNAIDAYAYAVSDRGLTAGVAHDGNGSYGWVRTATGNYRVLGTLPGYPRAVPEAINDNGDVAGELWTANGSASIAVFWPFNSPPVRITVPGMYPILGTGINDNQEVVGTVLTSLTPPLAFHAFVWTYNNQVGTDLGTMGGTDARATDINSAGDIAGWLSLPSGTTRAFVLPVGQNPVQLVYDPNANGRAVGINDLGVTMTEEYNSGTVMGVEWTSGYTIAEKWVTQVEVNDVNRSASTLTWDNAQPAVHFSHGATVGLPGFPNGLGHYAYDLNGPEWVVGEAWNSAGRGRAILWRPSGSPAEK